MESFPPKISVPLHPVVLPLRRLLRLTLQYKHTRVQHMCTCTRTQTPFLPHQIPSCLDVWGPLRQTRRVPLEDGQLEDTRNNAECFVSGRQRRECHLHTGSLGTHLGVQGGANSPAFSRIEWLHRTPPVGVLASRALVCTQAAVFAPFPLRVIVRAFGRSFRVMVKGGGFAVR